MPVSFNNTSVVFNDSSTQQTSPLKSLWLAETRLSGSNSLVSLTGGAWTTRRVTLVDGSISGASHNNTTWTTTLPAGSYLVSAAARTGNTSDGVQSRNTIRLRNIGTNTTLLVGIAGTTLDADFGFSYTNTQMVGMITLASSSSLQLQHWAGSTVNGGFAFTTGDIETYATIMFSKLS